MNSASDAQWPGRSAWSLQSGPVTETVGGRVRSSAVRWVAAAVLGIGTACGGCSAAAPVAVSLAPVTSPSPPSSQVGPPIGPSDRTEAVPDRACGLVTQSEAAALLGGDVDPGKGNGSGCVYQLHGERSLLNVTVSAGTVSAAQFDSAARFQQKTVPVSGLGEQAFATPDGTSIAVLRGGTELDVAVLFAPAGAAQVLSLTRKAVSRL